MMELPGRRKSDRPRRRYMDAVREDMGVGRPIGDGRRCGRQGGKL